MTFNSFAFTAFLPIVFTLHWATRGRARTGVLVGASYLFYGWWDARFLTLLAMSTVVDYVVGIYLETVADDRRRRALLAVSVVFNLGVLALFKYYDFFVSSLEGGLQDLGFDVSGPALRLTLPVGISFYTFQTMSYTIGVFRRTVRVERDPLVFALYVAFFPQLVAGPIERAERLLPQLRRHRSFPDLDRLGEGVHLILRGLFMKVVIADLAAGLVDEAYASPGRSGVAVLVLGTYAFALQIYGDFTGYTDIARGTAKLFGVDLMENFRQPYLSRTPTEFWRRWHISLSTWLRDYLYIPLGGSRRGRTRTQVNLLLTMLLGGLWHGAAWTFVAWGALHGLMLAAHRARPWGPGPDEPIDWRRDTPAMLVTFHLVAAAWILFRAGSVTDAVDVFGGIFSLRGGGVPVEFALLPVLAAAALVHDLAGRSVGPDRGSLGPVTRGLAIGAMLVGVIIASGVEPVTFVYFQF